MIVVLLPNLAAELGKRQANRLLGIAYPRDIGGLELVPLNSDREAIPPDKSADSGRSAPG